RTRDLWFGSHALSELSRAAARTLAENRATLIFPALDRGDSELNPCDEPTRRDTGKPPLSVANKILAELAAGIDPADQARKARCAVMARWRGIARTVREERGLSTLLAPDIEPVWHEQIDEAIEFYATWCPLTGGYKQAHDSVERALAGRKNLRDFPAWRHDRTGAP